MDRRKRFTALLVIGILLLLTPLTLKYLLPSKADAQPHDAEYFPVQDPETGKWGFIDNKGKPITKMVFDWTGDFRQGRGLTESDGLMGYIDADFDETGKWVISPRFKLLDPGDMPARGFYDGLALVRDDSGKWGYIDRDGKWAIEPKFPESRDYRGVPAGDFSGGLAWYQTVQISERYVFDENDKFVRDEDGDPIKENYPEMLMGYIDREGEVSIEPGFAMAQDFGEGLAAVRFKTDGQWGFIDRAGKRAISPSYEQVGRFSEGLCAVRKNGLWGYIDPEGNPVIEPQFAEARQFLEGLAPARKGVLWGYINPKGNWVIRPTFDNYEDAIHASRDPRPFENGLARVSLNGQLIYINPKGEQVWPRK